MAGPPRVVGTVPSIAFRTFDAHHPPAVGLSPDRDATLVARLLGTPLGRPEVPTRPGDAVADGPLPGALAPDERPPAQALAALEPDPIRDVDGRPLSWRSGAPRKHGPTDRPEGRSKARPTAEKPDPVDPVDPTGEAPAADPPAVVVPQHAAARSAIGSDALGRRIADAAKHYLRARPPRSFRDDCSGLVSAIVTRAGVPLDGHTAALWTRAEALGATHDGPPRPGDLVFFDDTYDRDRDGRLDDPLTHIGVVRAVEADGTVVVVHRSSSLGRAELRMNPGRATEHADADGRVLNDFLRARTARDPAGTRYLAGALLRGYARLRAEDADAWGP